LIVGDNNFPTVVANGGEFLSGYMKRKGFYEEGGTDIPGGSMRYVVEQQLGGPLKGEVEIAGSPGYPLTEKEINDRLYRYGMENTPTGADLKRRIREVQKRYGIRGV